MFTAATSHQTVRIVGVIFARVINYVVLLRTVTHMITYLSLRMALFSFFHWSLKSDENSCQMEKSVLGEISFSPALAFTEKNTVSSRNLTGHNVNQYLIILCKAVCFIFVWSVQLCFLMQCVLLFLLSH